MSWNNEDTRPTMPLHAHRADQIARAIKLVHPEVHAYNHMGNGEFTVTNGQGHISKILTWKRGNLHVWHREHWYPIVIEDLVSIFEGIT